MIKGTVIYKRPKAFSRKFIRSEVKAALGVEGLNWHRHTLRRHFEESAAAIYRYQKRSPKHIAEKLRRFGHRRPLVFSGAMSAQITRMARIVPSSKGVRVNMTGPRYLYMKRRDQKQPDKAAEITATTKSEERTIARSLHKSLSKRLNETAETTTTRF